VPLRVIGAMDQLRQLIAHMHVAIDNVVNVLVGVFPQFFGEEQRFRHILPLIHHGAQLAAKMIPIPRFRHHLFQFLWNRHPQRFHGFGQQHNVVLAFVALFVQGGEAGGKVHEGILLQQFGVQHVRLDNQGDSAPVGHVVNA